jgi:hypothetical protein
MMSESAAGHGRNEKPPVQLGQRPYPIERDNTMENNLPLTEAVAAFERAFKAYTDSLGKRDHPANQALQHLRYTEMVKAWEALQRAEEREEHNG